MKEILVGKLMDISQQVSPALLLGVCVLPGSSGG
jgi:hypothetical protein